jgi:hypothetical protein
MAILLMNRQGSNFLIKIMFNVLKEQIRRLNKLSEKVVTRVRSSEVYRLFPDKQFVWDFTNHSIFPLLDRLDVTRSHRFYKRLRGLLIVSLMGWAWKKGLDVQGEVQVPSVSPIGLLQQDCVQGRKAS